MTDLRCSRTRHAKALGTIVEIKCRECGRAMSQGTYRVEVYHRWDMEDGVWIELNDRIVHRSQPHANQAAA